VAAAGGTVAALSIEGRPQMRDLGESFSRTRPSPDGRHSVVFLYVGEIRFGPGLYRVEVNGRRLRNRLSSRLVTDVGVWSPDSRYIAFTELRPRSVRQAPDSALVVVDLQARRQCEVDRAPGGLAEPVEFRGSVLSYTRTCYNAERHPTVARCEANLLEARRWRRLWW
jgi:hypothetical protein